MVAYAKSRTARYFKWCLRVHNKKTEGWMWEYKADGTNEYTKDL